MVGGWDHCSGRGEPSSAAGYPVIHLGSNGAHAGLQGNTLWLLDSFRRTTTAASPWWGRGSRPYLADLELVCEDGTTFHGHKVICAAASVAIESRLQTVGVAIRDQLEAPPDPDPVSVELEGIGSPEMAKVMDWMYAGSAAIYTGDGQQSTQALLVKVAWVAKVLEIPWLLEECVRKLDASLEDRCLAECWTLGLDRGFAEVTDMCQCYAAVNFSRLMVAHGGGHEAPLLRVIAGFDLNKVVELLSDDRLAVWTEDQVWAALKYWVSLDPKARAPLVARRILSGPFSSAVRLAFLGAEASAEAAALAEEHGVPYGPVGELLPAGGSCSSGGGPPSPHMYPRPPPELVFVLMSNRRPNGTNTSLFCYDVVTDSWAGPLSGVTLPKHLQCLSQVVLNREELVLVSKGYLEAARIHSLGLSTLATRQLGTVHAGFQNTKYPYVVDHRGRMTLFFPDGSAESYDGRQGRWKVWTNYGAGRQRQRHPEASDPAGDPIVIRDEFMCGAVFVSFEDDLYLIGGMNEALTRTSAAIRRVDAATGAVREVARLSGGRAYLGCCVLAQSRTILVCGGYARPFADSLTTVEEFDPGNRTVRSWPNLGFFVTGLGVTSSRAGGDWVLCLENHQATSDNRALQRVSEQKRMQIKKGSAGSDWIECSPFGTIGTGGTRYPSHKWMLMGMATVDSSKVIAAGSVSKFLADPDTRRRCFFRKRPTLKEPAQAGLRDIGLMPGRVGEDADDHDDDDEELLTVRARL